MKKQAIVVGLGQFGMALGRALTREGVEVIAVDTSLDKVQTASEFAAQAMAFDATDEEALASLDPGKRDVCVSAIGDENREAAILVTALFRQLGAPRTVARATDDLMARILLLVGAHEVVNPERDFGERYARRLAYAGILDEITLGPDLVLSEIAVRPVMVGRSLRDLAMPKRFGITVLGVQVTVDGKQEMMLPDPDRALVESDRLLVVGRSEASSQLLGEW